MTERTKAKVPEPLLATQDYVLMINNDTEKRIEKAFHDQTMYLTKEFQSLTRWLIGLVVAMLAAIMTIVLGDFL